MIVHGLMCFVLVDRSVMLVEGVKPMVKGQSLQESGKKFRWGVELVPTDRKFLFSWLLVSEWVVSFVHLFFARDVVQESNRLSFG
ncbi:MAG TPA: hypothetical protein VFA77_02555 [Candidatus Eisenbacteria bacterium]|nr:hypothetical protein [Candidatus Eisenbacteria bacterium]